MSSSVCIRAHLWLLFPILRPVTLRGTGMSSNLRRRRPVIIVIAFLGLWLSFLPQQRVRAEEPKAPAVVAPIEFETETLDNGLRVVYAPLRQAPVVHVPVFYHVGSKDQKPDRP